MLYADVCIMRESLPQPVKVPILTRVYLSTTELLVYNFTELIEKRLLFLMKFHLPLLIEKGRRGK